MRFLREMIVRKSVAGAPGQAPDEPPVKDFFELPPMRDRIARRRPAEMDAEAGEDGAGLAGAAMDHGSEGTAGDTGDAAMPAGGRMRPQRPVPVARPRGDLARRPAGREAGDDLGFGADDDLDDLDGLDDLDAVEDWDDHGRRAEPAAPLRAPVAGARPAGRASASVEDDEADGAVDLTDDPALTALVAARRTATPVASQGVAPAVPSAAAPVADADDDAVDESAILANIAAALPPARTAAPAVTPAPAAVAATPGPVAGAAPVVMPAPAMQSPAMPAPAAPPVVAPAAVAAPSVPPAVETVAPAAVAPAGRAPRIWDLEAPPQVPDPVAAPPVVQAPVVQAPVVQAPVAPPQVASSPVSPAVASGPDLPGAVPAPGGADAPRRGGRVRTRLLGFNAAEELAPDPMSAATVNRPAGPAQFPVGWVVVIDGPGRGAAFTLGAGVSSIGRQEDQAIQLDFGDTAISRQMHAAIAYDPETRGFFLGQGGKSNIVRLNGRPVLSTEDLKDGDIIRIGETTLRLVAFCGRAFDWSDAPADPRADARA